MRKLKFFVAGSLAMWLVIGILLNPIMTATIQNFRAFVKSIEWSLLGYAFFPLISVMFIATLYMLKAKGLFDRIVASLFLVVHWFPALAWVLKLVSFLGVSAAPTINLDYGMPKLVSAGTVVSIIQSRRLNSLRGIKNCRLLNRLTIVSVNPVHVACPTVKGFFDLLSCDCDVAY
jgi:hypothetical protein